MNVSANIYKPKLPQEIFAKWQGAVEVIAEALGVEAAMVVTDSNPDFTVVCSSKDKIGPHRAAAGLSQDCAAVARGKQKLLVSDPNHGKSKADLRIRYLGFPLLWPDGEVFGVVCAVGFQDNGCGRLGENLLAQFRELMESHLALIYQSGGLFGSPEDWWNTIDAMEDGVLYHSCNRTITVFNKAAERITGIKRRDVLGKDCREVFPFGLCGANCGFCFEDAEITAGRTYETQFTSGKGKIKRLQMTVVPLKRSDGGLAGVVACFNEKGAAPRAADEESFSGIIGQNPKMLQLYDTIANVAHVEGPIVVLGESGTGKELVAKAIHDHSTRRAMPFIAVNCGAFAQGVIESELFGHVKGAFSGAIKDKKGCFERAHGGTLFLDEITELPRETQVKLLRVIQEKTFEPVGGEHTRTADVRIVSATNRDLQYLVEKGQFREDLYYRLAVFPISLPPLRDRSDDIPLLLDHFLDEFSKKISLARTSISPEALYVLSKYRWPGNIRQLQNAIHYALIKSKDGTILPQHLPPEVVQSVPLQQAKRAGRKQKLNRVDVLAVLKKVDGNKAKCARMLGVGRATLYNFIKKENIDA